ncbi:MAG: hypothetical protein ACLVB9_12095 [Acutalibacteraceae bacterium]
MKKHFCAVFVIFLIIFLSSCQTVQKAEDGLKEANSIDVGITHGVSRPDPTLRELTYDGNPIELEYYMHNRAGQQRWGLQIFVNGFQQPFYVDNSSFPSIQFCSDFEDRQEKFFKIKFTPIFGEKGDILDIHFIVMLNPTYTILAPTENSSYMANHTITQITGWHLIMNEDISEKQPDSLALEPSASIKLEERKNKSTDLAFNLYVNEKLVNLIRIDPAVPLKLSIGVLGYNKELQQTPLYRISVYTNHQIINCFNGSYYADIDISKAHDSLLLYDLEINTSALKKSYGNIYVIAVPIANKCTDTFPIIIKSRSLPLV